MVMDAPAGTITAAAVYPAGPMLNFCPAISALAPPSKVQTPMDGGALVRRFTGLAEMRHVKVVVEYREPLMMAGGMAGEDAPRFGRPAVLDDPVALAAFEARAEQAFRLERPGGDWAKGKDIVKVDAAPEQLKRREITRMLGILERDRGDDR